ncbi:competence protein ComGF [Faecalicoccus acidiformans]|uniref:Competence protein ComGF n=1 Tax=Faecalicoccus acidiformans TaxID=915173 RepID=A0A7W8FXV8_9FIRM|nr:competence type IV pilus minor pilin ComGF [Faecalicoccus acidiformans]MBB5184150.1 competence protein ComGF [Faecalicoccus acidiformans]
MKRSIKNGFTLIEALLGLLISSIVCVLCVLFLQTAAYIIRFEPLHQEQMAILQLRQILACSRDIQVDAAKLTMIYRHDEIRIEQDKNRLVKRDGYEILMEGVDQIHFEEENKDIFIYWTKHGHHYKIQIY